MKVLISAFSCSPGKGSEPGIGWNIVTRMAKFHDVWVVTRTHNRTDIEKVFPSSQSSNLNFIYFDLPIISRLANTPGLFNQCYYYLWHIFVYLVIFPLHRQQQFDLVHHITWGRYWMPNTASFLPIPFIFGPVAGGETVPEMFRKECKGSSWVYQILRNGFRWLGEHDPFVRATIKRSLVILAASEATFKRVENLGSSRVMLSGPQVGITQEEMTCLGKLKIAPTTPFRLMSIGRLLHWKGTHISLQAFAQAKLENSEFWIVGTGPELNNLKHLAIQLNIDDRVKFLGWLPREKVWERLERCHVLLHPCLRGLVTTAHLEAMAARRPVISVEVNDKTQILFSHEMGVEITAPSPDSIIASMATAIIELSENTLLREKIGGRERDCVGRKFIWDKKVTILESLYFQATELHKGSLIVYNPEDISTTLR